MSFQKVYITFESALQDSIGSAVFARNIFEKEESKKKTKYCTWEVSDSKRINRIRLILSASLLRVCWYEHWMVQSNRLSHIKQLWRRRQEELFDFQKTTHETMQGMKQTSCRCYFRFIIMQAFDWSPNGRNPTSIFREKTLAKCMKNFRITNKSKHLIKSPWDGRNRTYLQPPKISILPAFEWALDGCSRAGRFWEQHWKQMQFKNIKIQRTKKVFHKLSMK